jgi:N6-L-threonylcarbamoyladenine synthase
VLTLGIETSCDETSVALLRDESELLNHLVLSQMEHERYGGVVPELASRAHQQALLPMIEQALAECKLCPADIDLIGVTVGPGLIGALLVGICTAKSLAMALGRPLIGVNHVEAHLMANLLLSNPPEPPFVALLVSGGHTLLVEVDGWGKYLILGRSRDDAVGESFDKVAKMLGLGYPGGPVIEKAAESGNPAAFKFPRPMLRDNSLDMSFSGLKTAVLYETQDLAKRGELERAIPDLAASFQAAVADVLVGKSIRAVERSGASCLIVAGGVARNTLLRNRLDAASRREDIRVILPPMEFCTDNAAMVARTAIHYHKLGHNDGLAVAAFPTGALDWPVAG